MGLAIYRKSVVFFFCTTNEIHLAVTHACFDWGGSHFQEASAAISGSGVYGKLKFERGIHRVQVH